MKKKNKTGEVALSCIELQLIYERIHFSDGLKQPLRRPCITPYQLKLIKQGRPIKSRSGLT